MRHVTAAILMALAAVWLVGLHHVLAQSGGDYDLGWWSVDGGGGESSGGDFSLRGSAGQADAGALTGGDYELLGGFWHWPVTGRPKAIVDLKASKDGDHCLLTWSAITQDVNGKAIGGVSYNVYRALNDPYFTPATPYAPGVPDTAYLDPDTAVLSNSASNAFYVVRALSAGLEAENSNRVGTFVFDLVPGSS